MPEPCGFEKCPRNDSAKWFAMPQRHLRLKLFEKMYCGKDCLVWGVADSIRGELDRRKRKLGEAKGDLKWSKLGSICVAENLITREQLEVALKLQQWGSKKPLGECLVELGYITRDQLTQIISRQERRPFIATDQVEIEGSALTVPPGVAGLSKAVPCAVDVFTREISLACCAPIDKEGCTAIGRVMGLESVPFVVENARYEELLELYSSRAGKIPVYEHDEPLLMRNPTEVHESCGRVAAMLPLAEDDSLFFAFFHGRIWFRLARKPLGFHYFFKTVSD